MLAHPSHSRAHASTDVSDADSSSLSELEDIPDDQQGSQGESDGEDIRDNDTEASTERIDPSPQKARELHIRQPSGLDLLGDAAAVEQLQEADAMADEAIDDMDDLDIDDIPVPHEVIDPALREAHDAVPAESPRKRKRSSSLSDLEEELAEEAPPAGKRSHSDRGGKSGQQVAHHPHNAPHITVEDEDVNPGDQDPAEASSSDEHPTPQDDTAAQTAHITAEAEEEDRLSDATSTPPGQDQEQDPDQEGLADKPAPTDTEDQDAEDPTAKTEDEARRKNLALDDLKPIETLFAILRDKLFDERLASLATEIASLQAPTHLITHPDFLARRACIDARREAKIRYAETELAYKAGALERKALAERAVAHGQYVQEVRETRETHLERMNAHFSALQCERRQFKSRDPHFVYLFSGRRPALIKAQQFYNKEVSLLSGLARYEGFPAAPTLASARDPDRDDDLHRMKSLRHQSAFERSHLPAIPIPIPHLTTPHLNGGLLSTPVPAAYPPLQHLSTSNPPSAPHSQPSSAQTFHFSAALSAQHVPVAPASRQPQSYAARIASEEMSGADTFLERNPWARPVMAGLGRARSVGWSGAGDGHGGDDGQGAGGDGGGGSNGAGDGHGGDDGQGAGGDGGGGSNGAGSPVKTQNDERNGAKYEGEVDVEDVNARRWPEIEPAKLKRRQLRDMDVEVEEVPRFEHVDGANGWGMRGAVGVGS